MIVRIIMSLFGDNIAIISPGMVTCIKELDERVGRIGSLIVKTAHKFRSK